METGWKPGEQESREGSRRGGNRGEKEAILTKRRAPASCVEFRYKRRLLQHNKLPRKMAEKLEGGWKKKELLLYTAERQVDFE